ncbi:hypothetical protein ACP4OV_008476 [Aristida adscensionis]
MNPLTQVKRTQVINQKEALLGIGEDASWHARFKDSAYVFVGGVPYDLTEGDLLAVFAQYGEVVDVNLVRDKATGKSKGFAFLAYEDQRSTILAVDNLNGAKVLGRIIRVDHVSKYKKKEEEDEEELQKKREARGVCYAFQRGECNRGASCKYSHDEQRNANTGWGSKEDSDARWEHDKNRDPPKSHKKFPSSGNGDEDEEQKRREARGMCYDFMEGKCNRGSSCKFSHDEQLEIQTLVGSLGMVNHQDQSGIETKILEIGIMIEEQKIRTDVTDPLTDREVRGKQKIRTGVTDPLTDREVRGKQKIRTGVTDPLTDLEVRGKQKIRTGVTDPLTDREVTGKGTTIDTIKEEKKDQKDTGMMRDVMTQIASGQDMIKIVNVMKEEGERGRTPHEALGIGVCASLPVQYDKLS